MSMTNTALERVRSQQDVGRAYETTKSPMTYRPNADIFETTDAYIVSVDIPGVSADRIDIRLDTQTLTINGRVEPRYQSEARRLLQEYGIGDFHRSFRVGENIRADSISADYTDGVLTVTLPKTEAARPRRIEINSE